MPSADTVNAVNVHSNVVHANGVVIHGYSEARITDAVRLQPWRACPVASSVGPLLAA
ncbi:MAG: hypothetical protein AAGA41_10225 [Pseudomonadota bacterium]